MQYLLSKKKRLRNKREKERKKGKEGLLRENVYFFILKRRKGLTDTTIGKPVSNGKEV